jgi:hypothetical protein
LKKLDQNYAPLAKCNSLKLAPPCCQQQSNSQDDALCVAITSFIVGSAIGLNFVFQFTRKLRFYLKSTFRISDSKTFNDVFSFFPMALPIPNLVQSKSRRKPCQKSGNIIGFLSYIRFLRE